MAKESCSLLIIISIKVNFLMVSRTAKELILIKIHQMMCIKVSLLMDSNMVMVIWLRMMDPNLAVHMKMVR